MIIKTHTILQALSASHEKQTTDRTRLTYGSVITDKVMNRCLEIKPALTGRQDTNLITGGYDE